MHTDMLYDATSVALFISTHVFYKHLTGPKNNTMNDFWHMVWQENVTQIVMLTNLMEDGKVGLLINLQNLLHFLLLN